MKILIITPYITSSCHPAFLRNQTGFGYMVYDIARNMARTETVEVFAPMAFSPSMLVDGFKILGRNQWSFFKWTRYKNIIDGYRFIHKYPQSLKGNLRILYMYIATSQIERLVSQYDIVHIHGCTAITDATINICKRHNIPFLVTLHGLNSFEPSIKLHPSLCRYERDFLIESVYNQYPVSFLSSGNRQTAEAFIGNKTNSFQVICNGCNTERNPLRDDIRKRYSIADDDFVFVFVGNISKNKNQIQVARAWKLMPDNMRKRCKVLFVGRYTEQDELFQYVRNYAIEDNLILCGLQPKDAVSDFYYACNATILTSVTEGFGLSIIEGFVYGKPNVSFSDLPASSDIYDEKSMVIVNDRTDEALCDAMMKIMHSTFDSKYIISRAKLFSFEMMKENYFKTYKNIINTWEHSFLVQKK